MQDVFRGACRGVPAVLHHEAERMPPAWRSLDVARGFGP